MRAPLWLQVLEPVPRWCLAALALAEVAGKGAPGGSTLCGASCCGASVLNALSHSAVLLLQARWACWQELTSDLAPFRSLQTL